ncbi:DUF499 domain-containing protein [Sporolactobacillus sp. Y61]|uniref:DUF499 domain-containing protein n=1 Tax=Sporolactobacillus sp. Y61 TaxID=3160863 RepID=A0AAU8IGN0_9BACL
MSNHELVNRGFEYLLKALAPYIARELQIEYKDNWWLSGVLDVLRDEQKRNLPLTGSWGKLVDSLDIAACLNLIDFQWNQVFRKKLSIDHRTWTKELKGVRNKWAHAGSEDFDDDYTWRALDTMSRLCEQIDAESAENIRSLMRKFRYGSEKGSTAVVQNNRTGDARTAKNRGIMREVPLNGLPSWRDVIEPHPDVAAGRYKNAEFAADLAQVAHGDASYEYQDPVEFFARTYVTEGMSNLLVQALERVTGSGGEPVIQLKTAFGGGKTHSMLALYHLLGGKVSIDKIPNAKSVLEKAGLKSLPKANISVLVGTALNPSKSKRPNNFPGITINTLWGEMAAQLAASEGNPQLYSYVKEADRKGISPGSEALKNLFNACGPCVVLIDELVAYARKIYGVSGLPAGSFENIISFIQEITEAARASKNSLVVASIPESNLEIGGEAGRQVLATIEHTFGRMESVWKPVAADEGFEVVRRRLFLDCKDPAGREQVCSQFSKMYQNNSSDFPIQAKELAYKRELIACYPIHPEVFHRLYDDWATLENFQRTRGVLRLMAAVVHDLWMNNDAGLMIMPSSISLDNPLIRDELTRYLPESWNAIIDHEVDGKNSIPYIEDQQNRRFGQYLACRRVARTILFGSAPTNKKQSVRGIESSSIRLGIAQPGEQISVFNDALGKLQNKLSYLYADSSNNRFWFDTHPTLRKTAEDRAITLFSESDVLNEIERRLRKERKEKPFGGLHICPSSSLDVPDDQFARLVILKPTDTYDSRSKNSRAISAAQNILDNRGNTARLYRNMLAFVASDVNQIPSLKITIRLYLAWQSILRDKESLNLDATQVKETKVNIDRSDETARSRIKNAYQWLLVPRIDREIDLKAIIWDSSNIGGSDDSIVARAVRDMEQKDALITQWAPALLLLELDNVLWKNRDDISIKQLWEQLCSYCYLPRLASYEVLERAICEGIHSTEYFALAEAKSEERYIGLTYNRPITEVNPNSYLVKLVIALKQLTKEQTIKEPAPSEINPGGSENHDGGAAVEVDPNPNKDNGDKQEKAAQVIHFHMSAKLDNTRINRDVSRLVDEIINHVTSLDGSDVDIKLDVDANVTKGIPPETIRTVSENCRTLKIDNFGFDE